MYTLLITEYNVYFAHLKILKSSSLLAEFAVAMSGS